MSNKSSIFCLIDVSGSMAGAYSKDFSTSKIDSLTETIKNIVYSENILGSEEYIDFFALIFGTIKFQNWLNALEIFDYFLKNYNSDKKFDIDRIISDKKYECNNPEKKILELLTNEGAINLDKYISKVDKKHMNIIAYYLDKDRVLLREVYDRLPDCHKSIIIDGFNLESIKNTILYPLIYGYRASTRGVGSYYVDAEKEVKEHVDFVMEKIKNKLIEEIIPKFKQIKGETIYNIRKKYSQIFDKKDYYLKMINDYIYGLTPMKLIFNDVFEYINNNKKNNDENIIFLLSDGESTDGNPEILVKHKLIETNSILITCFLSSEETHCPKILYDENTRPMNLTRGESILYNMSTAISTSNQIFNLLEEKGWKVPKTGKCKLFVRINNPNILDEYLSLITILVRGNDALFDLIGKIDFEKYINNNINSFEPVTQHGGTCYAHAIATVIHMSLSRIYGRNPPPFDEIKNDLIKKYGEKGASTKNVLENELPKYKLHYKEVNEIEAKEAILKGRPCIFTFYLDEIGWAKFSKFYRENKGRKLTKEIFDSINNYGDDTPGGHAVVFVRYGSNYLEFINSWGKHWNNGGFFRVGDLKFFQNVHFYDVFWYITDLTEQDKKNWESRNQEVIKEGLSNLNIFNYKILCPNCKKISEASKFKGTFYKAECPLCNFSFVPSIEQLAKTLYLKQSFK